MLKATKRRQGGYTAPYSNVPVDDDYMLYNVPTTAVPVAAPSPQIYTPPESSTVAITAPGIQGGDASQRRTSRNTKADDMMELQDNFYYSLEGGCACNTGGNGRSCNNRNMKKGGDFALTPFISALALLGARLLADKNSGFNMNSFSEEENNTVTSMRQSPNSNNTAIAGGYYIGTPNSSRRTKRK
jgi:hypothetical protein